MATLDADAIRAATDTLAGLHAAFGERYQAAAKLLLNGGWHRHGQFVMFPPNVVAMTGYGGCSCQEGSGPIVCLHKVALAILALAERPSDWPRSGWTTIGRIDGAELRRCPAIEAPRC